MPYRTLDDRIDGVVITFADITAAKTLEAQLREKHAVLEKLVTPTIGWKTNPGRDKVTAGTGRNAKESRKGLGNRRHPTEYKTRRAQEPNISDPAERAAAPKRACVTSNRGQKPDEIKVRSRHPAAAPRIGGPPDRTGDAERGALRSQG
jgi:hypothetical protein